MPKLAEYKRKRDFARTPEPEGELSEAFCAQIVKKYRGKNLGARPIYVIQKHAARRLHFDLRLEINGVLKSWALPKEPPREGSVRRLAIQTEDHPLEYALFSGTIPKGNYGAGKVGIWDSGSYKADKLGEGEIIFTIKGRELKGSYCLIKMKPTPRFPGKNNWLFFRKKG